MQHSCPMCGKDAATRDTNAAFPFCSPRCRLLDLGNWLGESYRVPAVAEDDSETVPEAPDDETTRH